MSGPIIERIIGAIGSFEIGARPEINGVSVVLRADFPLVDDEARFNILVGPKLTGIVIACAERRLRPTKVCRKAKPLKPKGR